MSYLLDTNVCIRYLNGRSQAIKARLEGTDPSTVLLCSVVKAELLFGVAKSRASEQTRAKLDQFLQPFESLPFDDRAASHYASIRAQLERRGAPIGPNDLMIAAIALAHDTILVTANAREFTKVEDLRWEDWEAAGA